jgi:hypothetical protein
VLKAGFFVECVVEVVSCDVLSAARKAESYGQRKLWGSHKAECRR